MSEPKNEVANYLRQYASELVKKAGAPDRMTVADGQGGITTSPGTIPKDPGEADLKHDLPTDGTGRKSQALGGSPDRMTVADGQGGVTASAGTVPKDPGEEELKTDLPADGTVRKSANARISAIRSAIHSANPAMVPAPAVTPQVKSATAPEPISIDLSQDVLAKIASAALSSEEGINFIYGLFEKQAGEANAQIQIREAIQAAEAYDGAQQIKQAAYSDVFTKAAAVHDELAKIITESEAAYIIKSAALHQAALAELDHPLLKMAYAAGMDDAAGVEGADDAKGADGAPPPEQAIPMGGEQMSEEEIISLLKEMIDSGEITEQDVMSALEASGGAPPTDGGDGGAGGPPPPPPGGAGGPPPPPQQ